MTRALVAVSDPTYGGVYVSTNIDFTSLTTQPTWTKMATTGLANTLIKVMRVDPEDPYSYIYLQLDNDNVYRWNGVSWTLIMTLADAQVFLPGGIVGYIATNQITAGKVYLCVQTVGQVRLLYSSDYGATWAADTVDIDIMTGNPYVAAYGDNIVICTGEIYRMAYTGSIGSIWVPQYLWNNSGGGATIRIDPADPQYYYYRKDSADADLVRCGMGGMVEIQNGYSLASNIDWHEHTHWIDPTATAHHRILRSLSNNVSIYSTTDSWANFVNSTPTVLKAGFIKAVGALHCARENSNYCMFGVTEALGSQGIVEAFVGDNPTASYIIAGTNWNTAPYTNAIPYTADAYVAFSGIWVGEGINSAQKGIYVYSVETGVYDYNHHPMIGDRSAHHTLSYPDEHAEDVQKDTPYIHTPFPGAAGHGIISDGTKWIVSDDVTGIIGTVINNPHPGSLIDECTVRAYINGKVYWSSHRAQAPDTALGYEYAYNTITGVNAELSSQAGQAGWQSVYNAADGLIYIVGQIYADTILYRASVWTIDPATGTVTRYTLNAAGEATGDINELIGIIDDGAQIVAAERGPTALTTGSDYPNGGGVWTIPKASIATVASYTRVYEDSATPKREWRFMAKYGSTYLGMLYDTSTGVGAYVIQSSTDLTTWNVDVNGMALSLNDIRPAMIYHAANGKVYAATVNSSRQIVLRTYSGSWAAATFTNLTVPATGIIFLTLGTSGSNVVLTVSDWSARTHSIYLIYNLDTTPDYVVIASNVQGANNTSMIEAGPDIYYCTCYPGALVRMRLGSIGSHSPVTLDADAATILDISGQEIGLDTQAANTVLAGPTTGAANEPTFRTLALSNGDVSDVNIAGDGQGDILYNNSGIYEDYPLGIGSKISVTSNKLRFGNSSGGNYLEIDLTTGNLRLVGSATAWDDLLFPASVVKPGATAPSYKAFGPSGNLQALMFEASHHDEVHFEVQLPHRWKEGSKIYPHVHWTPTDTTAGNVVWELEYSWANISGAFGAPNNMASAATAAGGIAWVHKMTKLSESGNDYIDGTGKTMSSMLVCRLHRNSNAGSDTLNKDVALLDIDFHIEIDSFGSDEELVKDATSALLMETGDYLLLENGDNILLE